METKFDFYTLSLGNVPYAKMYRDTFNDLKSALDAAKAYGVTRIVTEEMCIGRPRGLIVERPKHFPIDNPKEYISLTHLLPEVGVVAN